MNEIAPSPTPLEEDDSYFYHSEPGHLVRRLHQIANSIFIDLMKDYDVTTIQYAVLVTVEAHDGYEQRQIGKLIAIDRATINTVTAKLEKRGLLLREHVGRRIDLHISEKGRALIKGASKMIPHHSQKLLAPLTKTQRATFVKLLEKVVEGNNSMSRVPVKAPDRGKSSGAQGKKRPTRTAK